MPRIPRRPPKPPFWDAEPGICRGCGQEFITKANQRHRGRRWCADCAAGWKVAGHVLRARAAVFQRDLGVCHDCGLDCTSYEVAGTAISETYRVQINRERALEWCEQVLAKSAYSRLYAIDLGDWHVDHAMPLHLIDRDKPDAWREWTLPNLRTRCPACHGEKTTKEAKARGKVRRIGKKVQFGGANDTKRPKSKIPQRANPWPARGARKIQSRGFQKRGGR